MIPARCTLFLFQKDQIHVVSARIVGNRHAANPVVPGCPHTDDHDREVQDCTLVLDARDIGRKLLLFSYYHVKCRQTFGPQTRLLYYRRSDRENQVAFGPCTPRFEAEVQSVHHHGRWIIEGYWVCLSSCLIAYTHRIQAEQRPCFTPMKV